LILAILLGGGFLGGLAVGWLSGEGKAGCLVAAVVPLAAFIYANFQLSVADASDLNSTSALVAVIWPLYASGAGAVGFFLGAHLRRRKRRN
jgi:hypothetical protein